MSNKLISILTQKLPVYNFNIQIPGVIDSSLMCFVQSTKFPSEQLQTIILTSRGERIKFPTIYQSPGAWQFTIPESTSGVVRDTILALKHKVYDQVTGKLINQKFFDVIVSVYSPKSPVSSTTDVVFQSILHGAWLETVGDVDVNVSDNETNFNNTFSFNYQWLEETSDKRLIKVDSVTLNRTLEITENGVYNTRNYEQVNVKVYPPLQSISEDVDQNGEYTYQPDSEHYGLSEVRVNVNVQGLWIEGDKLVIDVESDTGKIILTEK